MEDVENGSSTAAVATPQHSSTAFVLTEPQSSILTAPLTAHFTAVSPYSTLQLLHSVQRASSSASSTAACAVPLYRWTSSGTHKRQKRHAQQPPTASSVNVASSVPVCEQQATVEHVLAFHTASSISLPLLHFVIAQLRSPLLLALVDSGQSVTVLRLQDGIVTLPSHGQQKKSRAAASKVAASQATV